jgi:predicted CXXCH cytochrome family protein
MTSMPKHSRKRGPRSRTPARTPDTTFLRWPGNRHLAASVVVILVVALAAYMLITRGSVRSPAQVPQTAGLQRFIGGADAGYLDPGTCARCHEGIAATYRRTAMARAFYAARPENMTEDFTGARAYYHALSGDHYTMIRRGDQYFQLRHRLAPDGAEINVFESQIHYVMGSGNHARTYIHADPSGKLTELPLGWYAEKGGSWAMSPNYDQARHMGFQREVGFGCMFCHNSYPETAPGEDSQGREPRFRGRIPEGIDCQRCHGPGRDHVKAVVAGASADRIRAAIVNPARLDPERSLEICMQCHLETTSRPLPHAVVRFDRGIFSYRAGEPLSAYMLHFAPAAARDGVEIAHSAYRLRQSACFRSTAGTPGAMTCTTCHNPHRSLRGDDAVAHYVKVCRQCHAGDFDALVRRGRHPAPGNCIDCHMPKRRTTDVVHAVMTDHYIQRRKPARDLLAPLAEEPENSQTYRGEVELYYPPRLPQTLDSELYLSAAQVIDSADLARGVPRFRQAIASARPKEAGFYFHLAETASKSGLTSEALNLYEAALERAPKHRDAWLAYGAALSKAGRPERAAEALEKALEQVPDDPLLLSNLGEIYLADVFTRRGLQPRSLDLLLRAVAADPNLAAARHNLGLAYAAAGKPDLAERSWQEAIRIQPDYPLAHNSLANALAGRGQFAEAEIHYRQAIKFDPAYLDAHFNYAALLAGLNRTTQAEVELRTVVRLDPGSALAHSNLANLLRQRGDLRSAIEHYRLALARDPSLDRPHLGLGMALGSQGDLAGARREFETAIRSSDTEVQEAAWQAIRKIESLQRPEGR